MSQNLPARQDAPRETEVQKRDRKAREARGHFLTAVVEQRESFERSLRAYDLDFDVFMAAVEVGVERIAATQPEFFLDVPMASFMREVAKAAHVGLKPDGKQGAIVKFASDCTFMPMVEGYVEVIWKTGLVKDVNHNVVCEGDEFDFAEGDQGYVEHRRSLTRPANAATIGAWCVINLMTGGRVIEVVDQADLDRIAKVNKAKNGPRQNGWDREMHRKAPFRRAVKRMPKQERLSLLIELDDRLVRLEATADAGEDRPSAKALFGSRAIRRKRQPIPESPRDATDEEVDRASRAGLQEGEATVLDDLVGKSPAGVPPVEDAGQQDGDNSRTLGTPEPEPKEEAKPAADQPFVLRAVLSAKNGLQEFDDVELWYGDIRQKMQTLASNVLPKFWEINEPHVRTAGLHGHAPHAMKLVGYAMELGLIHGSADHE